MAKKGIAIISINKEGVEIAKTLKKSFRGARTFQCRMDWDGSLRSLVKKVFYEYDGLIFITALGIVVRLIGPLAKSKKSDPGVVAVDSAGRFAISVLSGHEGGANRLTFQTAACIDATPVITTGTEAHKRYVVGLGMRKGVKPVQVREAIEHLLKKNNIGLDQVRAVATVDLKKDEKGLLRACAGLDLPLVFISRHDIANFQGNISRSEVVRRHLGVDGVCEPCALLAGRRTRLLSKKEIIGAVTAAIAEEN